MALGLSAQLSEFDEGKAADREKLDEPRACISALNNDRTAFSNGPQAREARVALESAGRTAHDCRKLLDIRISPLTVLLVAVEQGKQVKLQALPVTDLRCFALLMRLERAIARGKPLRKSLRPDEEKRTWHLRRNSSLGKHMLSLRASSDKPLMLRKSLSGSRVAFVRSRACPRHRCCIPELTRAPPTVHSARASSD